MRSMSGINARMLERAHSAVCFARGFAQLGTTSTGYRLTLGTFAGKDNFDAKTYRQHFLGKNIHVRNYVPPVVFVRFNLRQLRRRGY